MRPSSLYLLTIFAAIFLRPVFEAAHAQQTGPNRGVQVEPVVPEMQVPEKFGPATSQPDRADGKGNPARERHPLYRLAKSDVIDVSFAFAPEFNQTVTVQPDGFVSLRDVGNVLAEGLTTPELEQAIAAAYAAILHEPNVTAMLKDFERPYFIAAGEVTHPGKYELRSLTTVSAAIAMAGGFTQNSKHSQVVVFRRVSPALLETRVLNVKQMLNRRNLNEDLSLQPGDYVFVPRSTVSKIMRFVPATSMGLYSSAARF